MSFIECCKDGLFKSKIYINISQIISFRLYDSSYNEKWYECTTSDNHYYYTTYNLPSLAIYSLNSF